MKICFLTFTLLLFIQIAFSQDYTLDYFPNVNKAESFLVDGNYEDALSEYEVAFKLKGFGNDYYNASICSVLSNHFELATKYLLKLADKGLTISYLKKNKIFEKIPTNIYSKFLREYNTRYNSFYARKNYTLETELEYLVSEDQRLRGFENSYTDDSIMTQINKIDSSNVKQFLKLIESNGYPSENEIGLCDSVNYFHKFDLIIWHQNYKEDQIYNFEQVIKKALKEGRINQDYGGMLIEKSVGRNTYWTEVVFRVIPDGILLTKYLQKDYLDLRIKKAYNSVYTDRLQIDTLRSSIGMRPITEYLKVLYFGTDCLIYGKHYRFHQ